MCALGASGAGAAVARVCVWVQKCPLGLRPVKLLPAPALCQRGAQSLPRGSLRGTLTPSGRVWERPGICGGGAAPCHRPSWSLTVYMVSGPSSFILRVPVLTDLYCHSHPRTLSRTGLLPREAVTEPRAVSRGFLEEVACEWALGEMLRTPPVGTQGRLRLECRARRQELVGVGQGGGGGRWGGGQAALC